MPRFGKNTRCAFHRWKSKLGYSLLDEEQLQNPTLDKYAVRVPSVQTRAKVGLIPRTQEANPLQFVRQSSTSDYEAICFTTENTFEIFALMPH